MVIHPAYFLVEIVYWVVFNLVILKKVLAFFFSFLITTRHSFRDSVAFLRVIIFTHSLLDLCSVAWYSLSNYIVRIGKHFQCCTLLRTKFTLTQGTVQKHFWNLPLPVCLNLISRHQVQFLVSCVVAAPLSTTLMVRQTSHPNNKTTQLCVMFIDITFFSDRLP